MRSDRRPAWLVDLKWIAAICLVVSVAVATSAAAAARVTAPGRSEALARELVALILGPSDDDVAVAVAAGGSRAGEAVALLPGADVFVDPSEVDGFTVEEAVSRAAGVLTDGVLTAGAPATWASIEDHAWRAQLESLERTSLRPLANAALQRALLGVGLDDGTRAANWPAQAAQNPGQPVQPIAAIAVLVPPGELAGQSHRQIGERVVDGIAEVLTDAGAAAALSLVDSPPVAEALRSAIDGPVRHDLHAAIEASVAVRADQIAAVLDGARAGGADDPSRQDAWAEVLGGTELAGLDAAERRERVEAVLTRRALASGSAGLLELLEGTASAERLAVTAPVVDGVGRDAHRRYLLWAWAAGAASLALAALLVALTNGPGRAFWPGLCLLLAAGPGLALATRWRTLATAGELSAGAPGETLAAELERALTTLAARLAPVAAESVYWVYLVVAGSGAALLVMAAAASLAGRAQPRRRSLV
jgi:hypothetical protein